ncbi:Endo-type membrane-bound lytic murein transglycosylase A precursor [Serratia fonticola]|uniref:peptidoglycan lytic exotransglycosylase n=1 Tax=Serratia fonticola TaxID=47917 RepID=A0A4U9W6K2_SERFO|nr:Endo-type membrane-bound lytic murein transglycosylase A precursor [Serratia fonticola]
MAQQSVHSSLEFHDPLFLIFAAPGHCWLMLLVLAGCSSKHQRTSHDPHAYDDEIEDAADEYDVDEKLIAAIIQVESGFNPKAVSPSNAIGLMQLKANTAGCDAYRFKGKRGCPDDDDLLDPETNIDLGGRPISAHCNSSN